MWSTKALLTCRNMSVFSQNACHLDSDGVTSSGWESRVFMTHPECRKRHHSRVSGSTSAWSRLCSRVAPEGQTFRCSFDLRLQTLEDLWCLPASGASIESINYLRRRFKNYKPVWISTSELTLGSFSTIPSTSTIDWLCICIYPDYASSQRKSLYEQCMCWFNKCPL